MSRWIAALLSILGPVLVFSGAWSVLDGWRDEDDAMAERNAGRILNARVIDRSVVDAMEQLLDHHQPEVLIIGPSYANTDVRPELLAQRLGVPRDRVLLLSVPNSVGAHWYAILKNRVFANGHRPSLVVVVSGLQSMLLNTPLTESSFVNLRVHLGEAPDAEIAARVQQTTTMRLARLREQRGKVRQALFDALRVRPVAALFEGRQGPLMPAEARMALDRVFDDARVDMRLHQGSMPVVEANRRDERAYTPDLLAAPEASFIPVITDLVAEHGGRTIWVRPPMSPHIPEDLDDVVLPGTQEAVLATLSARTGDYLDMRGLPMTAAMFRNEDHMNEEGSRRFSEALARALVELDAMEPKARPDLIGALSFTRSVDGEVPGDGLQIAPGGRATWSVPEGWDRLRGSFAAEISLAHEHPDTSPPAVITVAGEPMALAPSASERGSRFHGLLRRARPEGPFEVVVQVHPQAPGPVRIESLALGRHDGRTFLVGDADTLDGRRVALFGMARLPDGRFEDLTVRPRFLKPPVTPPGHDRPVTDLPGTPVAAFETERWAFLSDERLMGMSSFGSRCSPLRISEDGTLLPQANVPCLEVKRLGKGRSCHTTDRIFFSARDRTDPATNGRTYRLVLDERRLCDGAVFLYPRDAFEVAFPAEKLAEGDALLHYFTLGAKYLNNREAELQVVLTVDGEVRIDERVQGRDFNKVGPKVWRLDPPLGAAARDVRLRVENKASVFYLLTDAALSERASIAP